jgi:hypothetical protein
VFYLVWRGSWTPLASSVCSRNITSQLLMILLVSTHIKQYALLLSQYPKNKLKFIKLNFGF